jgi:nucleotide-binding universal stress UspA family protein
MRYLFETITQTDRYIVMAPPVQAILCTVDFSPFSPMVVDCGVAMARRAGLPLYLLHAVLDPQDGAHPTTVFERGGDLIHSVEDARSRIRGMLADAPIEGKVVVRFGDPVEQTIAVVDELPPCLVISASHGVSGFRRLFVGTVVERLTRALKCPMLVVKAIKGGNGCNTFRSAVISCDGHGHWRRLAPLLALIQTDTASRIHLVHAMEYATNRKLVDPEAASYGEVQQALQDRLGREYRRQGQTLFPETHRLTVAVAPGVPEELVLRAARDQSSDLIAVGVRHSRRMGRLLSGSTTETLLRHAPCSVLTVPEPAETDDHAGDPQ